MTIVYFIYIWFYFTGQLLKLWFNSVFEDYDSMLYTMSDNPNPQDIIIAKLLPFPKSKIINAIEYENP
jgi:hypothetical protein